MNRRRLLALLLVPGSAAIKAPFDKLGVRPFGALLAAAGRPAQDAAPSRRDITITARDFRFIPDRIETVQDDLIRITVVSDDLTHSFNIDEYRIAKRVPPKGRVVVEFRADRVGTFPFYCNITSEPGHDGMRGQLVVRPK